MLSEIDGSGADELSSVERIRNAALNCFARDGASATSLRTVAGAAGVSLGLVQHHFATKAGLIKAVDDHVMGTVLATVSRPIPDPPADSIVEIGNRVVRFIREQPVIVDYVGRALVDGSPLGNMIFDQLAELGMARWEQRRDNGETRPDLDMTWAALNALVLALGTLILRGHIERHLPERFDSPDQLRRWQTATDALLREGQLRHTHDYDDE
ncbi:TetR/AcrR family transcriptional regulator [Mycobacterium deserti]|uniref:TetR/AcrR family transcriptional regulator n=1 Tax=Mycobacterium deserti TaxID=2978347 RepID=UPI0036F2D512